MMQFDDKFDAATAQMLARVDQELGQMGGFIVSRMQQYAPVDTGLLRSSIHDKVDTADHSLTVFIPPFYGIYQEFGTRFIRPHPYARPAILDAHQRWEFSDVTFYLHPAAQLSEPLRATTSGFRLPQHQKLTASQEAHVRKHLIPTSRRIAGQFRRRKIAFSVIGPKT